MERGFYVETKANQNTKEMFKWIHRRFFQASQQMVML